MVKWELKTEPAMPANYIFKHKTFTYTWQKRFSGAFTVHLGCSDRIMYELVYKRAFNRVYPIQDLDLACGSSNFS